MGSQEWLEALGSFGMRPGLENISRLLHELGDPQKDFKTIHVAGSDGKGSTCAMLSSILRTSGFVTGSYTSPHITDITERINVDGRDISSREFADIIEKIRPIAEKMETEGKQCTFFEVTTAAAFLYFSIRGTDYAVIETGLGGRLDATNVIVPEVSVITHIGLEHTSVLGDTIEKIAYEKAGIIKPNVPVITANTGVALNVISKISKEKNAELSVVDVHTITDIAVDHYGTSFEFLGERYRTSIPGTYQAENAAVAIEALRTLDVWNILKTNVTEGLADARWGCRMERVGNIIMDVTHTHSGAVMLAKDIEKLYGKVVLVFGILDDKDIDPIVSELSRISSNVIVTRPDSERAADISRLKGSFLRYRGDVHTADTVKEAIEKAFELRKNGEFILVTGSLFMAGDAKKWSRTYAGS